MNKYWQPPRCKKHEPFLDPIGCAVRNAVDHFQKDRGITQCDALHVFQLAMKSGAMRRELVALIIEEMKNQRCDWN